MATDDERDVLYHLSQAQDSVTSVNPFTASLYVHLHIGTAIALAVLEVARAIREQAKDLRW